MPAELHHLAAKLAAAEVDGIQSEGVVACVKHWVDNNAEGPGHNGRLSTSSVVDRRVQHELYFQPFEGAIKAGVGSAMCRCAMDFFAPMRFVRHRTDTRSSLPACLTPQLQPRVLGRQAHLLVRGPV